MLLLAVVAGVVVLSGRAEAIKWDFDDGTTQGWSAKEAQIWGGTRELYLFPGVVEDGVWRITVDPEVTKGYYSAASISVVSSAELVSPTIGTIRVCSTASASGFALSTTALRSVVFRSLGPTSTTLG